MKWIITIRAQAKADLRRAHDWYQERCAGLGDEFLADHAEALLRLQADPEHFPTVVFAGFSLVAFLTESFSASWANTSSSVAFCLARKTTRANSPHEHSGWLYLGGMAPTWTSAPGDVSLASCQPGEPDHSAGRAPFA